MKSPSMQHATKVKLGEKVFAIQDSIIFSNPLLDLKMDGHSHHVQLTGRLGGGRYQIRYLGTVYPVSVMDKATADLAKYMPVSVEVDTSSVVLAPMPGMLKSVVAVEGEEVAEGQEVAILEAMKMQNSLVAAKTGKVKKVYFKAGDTVEEGDMIVELE